MRRRAMRELRNRATAGGAGRRDGGLHHGATAPYDPLQTESLDRVIEATLTLLEESGVVFEPGSEAAELLAAAGCPGSPEGIVRIPRALTLEALASGARSVRLWDRAGESCVEISERHTRFFPGMTCIRVFDPATGEARSSTRADLATITRVADALPHIDGVCLTVKNVERSDIFGEIDEFAALAENTTKPLEYLCEHPESLGVVIEMAAAIRGGRPALAERPYFLQIVTPLPLNYGRMQSDQIILAARAGVPVSVGTIPIGGASSPITIAGCMVQSLTTDLAAMVLAQLVRPGAFCIGSSDVSFMEPATGGIGGFVKASLADMAMCQIRRRLGVPSFTGIGGWAVARRFNQDAVWEISSNMMQAFYSRPATLDYLGSLDQGMIYSLHALLLCDDLAGMLKTLWEGVAIDDERLALDLAREIGPLGNYLAQRHTVAHCRTQLWDTRYFGPHIPLANSDAPDADLIERIDLDLRRILAEHVPPPLDPAVLAALRRLQAEFAASWTGGEG